MFDPFWTDLIEKIQNTTAIFILFVNVTTWQTRKNGNKQKNTRSLHKSETKVITRRRACTLLALKISFFTMFLTTEEI